MAQVLNDWIGYLDRSYQQIKSSLLSRVTTSNPEMTDHSESNPFVIIISMFAGIAEMLGYYVDNIARETFIGTAQDRNSIIKHTRKLDYRIKARSPESAEIIITWTDGVGVPRNTPSAFTLLAGSSVQSTTGITYRLPSDVAIASGISTSQVTFNQYAEVLSSNLGTSDGSKNQQYSLGTNYREGSLQITINSVVWTLVDTFALSTANDKHFLVDIETDGNAYVRFGDGINGTIPDNTFDIIADYRTTLGVDGKVKADTLTENVTLLGLPADTDGDTTNPNNSSGGSDYEADEDIVVNAVNSIRTLNRAVTFDDYKVVTEEIAGVARAAIKFCCGKTIDIYIVPDGGGIATTTLINSVQSDLDDKKMVTTFVAVKAAGESILKFQMTITAKRRADLTQVKNDVDTALLNFGDVSNQEINGSIRISDLQALVDNVRNVDYVDLDFLYIIPYPRPENHTRVLVWETETTEISTGILDWTLQYDNTNTEMRLLKGNVYVANIPIDTEYDTGYGFKFTWSAGSYQDGDTWNFKTYPYTTNIDLEDFTIPVVDSNEFSTIVNAAEPLNTKSNC